MRAVIATPRRTGSRPKRGMTGSVSDDRIQEVEMSRQDARKRYTVTATRECSVRLRDVLNGKVLGAVLAAVATVVVTVASASNPSLILIGAAVVLALITVGTAVVAVRSAREEMERKRRETIQAAFEELGPVASLDPHGDLAVRLSPRSKDNVYIARDCDE